MFFVLLTLLFVLGRRNSRPTLSTYNDIDDDDEHNNNNNNNIDSNNNETNEIIVDDAIEFAALRNVVNTSSTPFLVTLTAMPLRQRRENNNVNNENNVKADDSRCALAVTWATMRPLARAVVRRRVEVGFGAAQDRTLRQTCRISPC